MLVPLAIISFTGSVIYKIREDFFPNKVTFSTNFILAIEIM